MSMLHGRQRGKNRSLDGTIIRNESDNKLQEGTKLHELGKRFVKAGDRPENGRRGAF